MIQCGFPDFMALGAFDRRIVTSSVGQDSRQMTQIPMPGILFPIVLHSFKSQGFSLLSYQVKIMLMRERQDDNKENDGNAGRQMGRWITHVR